MQPQAAFDFTLTRRTDPPTSRAAAAQASFAVSHCARILQALRDHGPQTKDDLSARTGIDAVAIARRIATLRDQQLVRDSKTTGKTPAGRDAIRWEATP